MTMFFFFARRFLCVTRVLINQLDQTIGREQINFVHRLFSPHVCILSASTTSGKLNGKFFFDLIIFITIISFHHEFKMLSRYKRLGRRFDWICQITKTFKLDLSKIEVCSSSDRMLKDHVYRWRRAIQT